MNLARALAPERFQRGALAYMMICLSSLLFLYQLMEENGAGDWSFLPALIGSAGVFLRWNMAPLWLIGSMVLTFLAERNSFLLQSTATLRLGDMLLCATVLAYTMAHFRLTLIHTPFPTEQAPSRSRRSRPQQVDESDIQRDQPEAMFIPARELGFLLLSLPVWTGLSHVAWLILPQRAGNPGVAVPVWRLWWLLWLVGGIAFVVAAVLDYWYRRTMAVEEATLYLQDMLWRETRGEQRRINRWFAWARVCARQPSLWQDIKANRWLLILILIADLLVVLFILGRREPPVQTFNTVGIPLRSF